MGKYLLTVAALAAPIAFAQPALAAPGDPVKLAPGLTLDPIIDGRLRFEHVDQPTSDADAVTMRLRAGFELKSSTGLALLVEGEGSLAIVDQYNAFPFAIADAQRRPLRSTIADPMTIELNRVQLQYKTKDFTGTVGRQRINLDDQRWVGNVGWRQNEQTFDALRAEAKLGPVSLDATYAGNQRTIFGFNAGPRTDFEGDFVFLGASGKLGPVNLKAFAYLLDYDEAFFVSNSSQTYGARATTSFKLSPKAKLNLAVSYAHQWDYGSNPFSYDAGYIAAEAGVAMGGLSVAAGYEQLGTGSGRSLQTPMATLHKFNGWADLFLTTPAAGLQDMYGQVGYKFEKFKALPGLNASLAYHRFESVTGSAHYGDEWDALVGFKLGRTSLTAKYANYSRSTFGSDTEKFWLQLEFAY